MQIFEHNCDEDKVRVSCGHLCEAEAPTETTVETRKSEIILSYGELFPNAVISTICQKDA